MFFFIKENTDWKPADYYEEERATDIPEYNIPIVIARWIAAFEFKNNVTLNQSQLHLLTAKLLDILFNPSSSLEFVLVRCVN